MRTFLALLTAVPLLAYAQEGSPPPSPPPSPAPPGAAPQAQPAPAPAPEPSAEAPQYAPPPQHAPPAQPAYPQAYYEPQGKQRGGWYIGFGLGGGDGSVHFSDGTADFEDMVYPGRDTFSFNFRVGATVLPNLLFGFDGGFVAASSEQAGSKSSIQLNHYDAGLMYFPTGRGPYLRAAAGLSSIVWDVEGLFEDSAGGFNVLGGVGYAFWLGRSFNLTLNVDAARHFFSEGALEGGTAWSAWVGFDWY